MPAVTIDKKYLVDELTKYFNVAEMQVHLSAFKEPGSNFFSMPRKIFNIFVDVINAIEKITTDVQQCSGSGAVKRDAVVSFLDEVIKLPFYLEPFDGIAIGFAVDAIVLFANKLFGKNWFAEGNTIQKYENV